MHASSIPFPHILPACHFDQLVTVCQLCWCRWSLFLMHCECTYFHWHIKSLNSVERSRCCIPSQMIRYAWVREQTLPDSWLLFFCRRLYTTPLSCSTVWWWAEKESGLTEQQNCDARTAHYIQLKTLCTLLRLIATSTTCYETLIPLLSSFTGEGKMAEELAKRVRVLCWVSFCGKKG